MRSHKNALILNADYTAISIIDWKNAIKLDVCDIAQVIDFYKGDFIMCSNNMKLPCPSVLVLRKYEKCQNIKIPFSRNNIFMRDKMRCQYCNKRLHYRQLSLDHVVPRSRVGKNPTHWGNIVTCCHPCNRLKGSFLLEDCGMTLINKPVKPNPKLFVLGLGPASTIEKPWMPYLPKHYLELLKIAD